MSNWRERYKTWEEFFGKSPRGLLDFKEILTNSKKSITWNSDELLSIFQNKEVGLVNSLEDAEELLSELNNVCVDYGDGCIQSIKRKRQKFLFYRFLFMGRLLLNHLFISPVFFH